MYYKQISEVQIHFLMVFVIIAQLMKFLINKPNLPGENLSK